MLNYRDLSVAALDTVDKNISILIADDHRLTRDMVRSILKQLGFANVITVENGRKALEYLSTEKVDLMICDWNMPGFSGLDVLRRVRATAKTKDLLFLMLTAEAYRENVVEAVKAGVTDYVVKPFTSQTIVDKLESVLAKPKQ